jgi:hypothetical protein
MTRPFARGLSDAFMVWLGTARGRTLLELFRDDCFDIRLRENYFNVYEAQCSLARVEWVAGSETARLVVNRKYLAGTTLQTDGPDDYEAFDVNDDFVGQYGELLPALRRTACELHGDEGLLEAKCLRDNRTGTPLLAFDRQIILPGRRDRLDVLAVAADRSRPLMVAVELKRGLNNDIQGVAAQTLKYMEMLDPDGAGLRPDVARAYQRVCSQLRVLGWEAPDPTLITPGMPVGGLAGLADYNAKSKLLGRAEAAAKNLVRPVGFCHLDMAKLVLPDPATWASEGPQVERV